MYGQSLLFLLVAVLLPLNYLWIPASRKLSRQQVPWYDILLAVLSFAIPIYFITRQEALYTGGWEQKAPLIPVILGGILWLLVIEATRRGTGVFLAVIVLFLSLYPLWSVHVPIRMLWGHSIPLDTLVCAQIFSKQGMMGLIMGIFGELVFGFMVFAAVVQAFGAGKFFNDLAVALVAKTRGGTAKIAIMSSGLFASINGAVGPNVMTTGPFTIPAMKKAGFSSHFACGVEAAASSGGTLMPPVMGAVAFIMSEFIGVSYGIICIAAAVPAVLYFMCLFVQIDAYAGRRGMLPMSQDVKAPPVWLTLLRNTHILAGIAVLVFMLFVMRVMAQAPWYATATILVLGMLQKRHRLGINNLVRVSETIGRTLGGLQPALAGIGLIIGALTCTGVALSLPHSIVQQAGDSAFLMVVIGAFTALLLGMGMTVSAVYIFLAIVLAPGLVEFGFTVLASHLFIIYFGIISHITPPVAIAAFVAAPIGGASPMRTSVEAMKLGGAIYILPFIFIFNPALILQAPVSEIAWVVPSAALGLIIIGGAVERYMWTMGSLTLFSSVLLFAGGLAIAVPILSVPICGLGGVLLFVLVEKALVKGESPLVKYLVTQPGGR